MRGASTSHSPAGASLQPSNLLPALFEKLPEDRPLTVFHTGAALPETVDFFANFRCTLHFVDLFSELPFEESEEQPEPVSEQFARQLVFPEGTRFDICLFWDVFSYLNRDALFTLMRQLKPYLHVHSMGHAYVPHALDKPQNDHLYGINGTGEVSIRHRKAPLPGYAPHNQSKLKELLHCFRVERNVLLPDSRLEMTLRARL